VPAERRRRGAIVTQMWVMIPAPFTSKMSFLVPAGMGDTLSALPPVRS
jgi:hypothetical protein